MPHNEYELQCTARYMEACIIRDTKASVVPFNQVSADHAFKEDGDNRSLNKWCEVHRRAFAKDIFNP